MERLLEGKTVLVTGAGVRVGRAIAEMLGRAGADVAAHFHRSEAGVDELLAGLRADGNRAEKFGADLSDPAQAADLVERVESRLGPIHALVSSAAVFDRADFLETPLELLERQWAVNARAPYVLTQAVARKMVGRGGGHVVNIIDIGGAITAWARYSAYCMSKAALASLTRCLALELAPWGIRVNGVAPGTVLPPESMDARTLDALKEKIPAGRFGSPEDVARTVLFLITGPAFITGQIVAVDGGRSLGTRTL
ncbi:MAG: SDR family oxidoreductase [Myxococcaceae bacterium]|nr:SDR family oxidoreductase [Myxococcaceae bacterium]